MNELHERGIPLDVIVKGRDLDSVLGEYMIAWNEAKKVATAPGKSENEIFADTMMAVAYRIYLLGVEDGMKESAK